MPPKKSSTPPPDVFYEPLSCTNDDRIQGLLSLPTALNVRHHIHILLPSPLPSCFSQFIADLFSCFSSQHLTIDQSSQALTAIHSHLFTPSGLSLSCVEPIRSDLLTFLPFNTCTTIVNLIESTITPHFYLFSSCFSLASNKSNPNPNPNPKSNSYPMLIPNFSTSILPPLNTATHKLELSDLNRVVTQEHEMVIRDYIKGLVDELKNETLSTIDNLVDQMKNKIEIIEIEKEKEINDENEQEKEEKVKGKKK
ncbi:hypothetical protein P9112_009663 [Eukaryota sp. TZLM1-RC]